MTNAVLYAHSRVEVTIRNLDDCTRVEVRDASAHLPEMRTPRQTGGRGLHLVESLTDCWGIEGRVDGKTVWFEVSSSSDATVIPP